MIHIVTAENRHLFRHALMEMHRQRKAVFIDELGWRLNGETGIEIDAYDAEDVIYLIEADAPRSAVTGSARLLPTGRPHLLSEAFADLCDYPGLPDTSPDPIPHFFQLIGDDLRCAMKLESDLGVHVEVAPPFDKFF